MSTRGRTFQLGTRGSDLALRQAATVQETLSSRRQAVELVEVETRGDQIRDELIHRLGKTGAFVRSIDEKVLSGDLDGAIHSMKDMPTEQPDELVVAGVPERAAATDVLVTPDGTTLDDLPEGATVGTSSLRRGAQLLAERPDLAVEPLRGNVDTRLVKLLAPSLQREHAERSDAEDDRKANVDNDDYEHPYDRTVEEWFDDLAEIERRALEREVETAYDAIVLAEAGLERSGLLHHVEYQRLSPDTFVPAAGQGALAITAVDDEVVEYVRDTIDHPRSRVETTVERTVLEELGGGCVAPVGIHAVVQGEYVHTRVRVLSRDGTEEVSESRDLSVQNHAKEARDFAAHLAEKGGAELIEQARREAEE
ncbi:hydroxymethylbilane synthase [Haloarculaceae archaeon H-GB2-1]|nr:hydroxymethylbilane synthase [Haloarculaceae archaeon H-GB1-1]MEA5385822.1 hydroxymethylbilane synthase [Haloarculaceae archaeon H-GB11]MEA5407322.1 hydroxymethylbilane synthase [Haloarculaceae archaeon H-GB2-1]